MAKKRYLPPCWCGERRAAGGLAGDGERSHLQGGTEVEPNLHSPSMGDCSNPSFAELAEVVFKLLCLNPACLTC